MKMGSESGGGGDGDQWPSMKVDSGSANGPPSAHEGGRSEVNALAAFSDWEAGAVVVEIIRFEVAGLMLLMGNPRRGRAIIRYSALRALAWLWMSLQAAAV